MKIKKDHWSWEAPVIFLLILTLEVSWHYPLLLRGRSPLFRSTNYFIFSDRLGRVLDYVVALIFPRYSALALLAPKISPVCLSPTTKYFMPFTTTELSMFEASTSESRTPSFSIVSLPNSMLASG